MSDTVALMLGSGAVCFAVLAGSVSWMLSKAYYGEQARVVSCEVDMDLFDAEMAMEGARIEEQLAAERRALIVAGVR